MPIKNQYSPNYLPDLNHVRRIAPGRVAYSSEPYAWKSTLLNELHMPAQVGLQESERPILPAMPALRVGLVTEGAVKGFFKLSDSPRERLIMSSGGIYLIPPGRSFTWAWQSETQVKLLNLHLSPALLMSVVKKYPKLEHYLDDLPHQVDYYDPLIRQLILSLQNELKQQNIYGASFAEDIAYLMVSRILLQSCGLEKEDDSGTCPKGGLTHYQHKRVTEYIHENLDKALDGEKLGALVGYERSHFSKIFKKTMDISPHQYLVQCRMEKAKIVLRTTDFSIENIALDLAYKNSANFCNAFKKYEGLSPIKFRRYAKNQIKKSEG